VSVKGLKNQVSRYRGLSPAGVAFALSQWVAGANLNRYKKISAQKCTENDSLAPAKEEIDDSVLVICPDTKSADDLFLDLRFFSPSVVKRFTSWEILPYEQLSPLVEVVAERITFLNRLYNNLPTLIVTSPDALLQKLIRPDLLATGIIKLKLGESYSREELINFLDLIGYRRATLTEEIGQFSIRGAVIDLFPGNSVHPLRIGFFGDTIESLRLFDAQSQRSVRQLSEFSILPVREHLQPSRLKDLRIIQAPVVIHPEEELQQLIQRLNASAEESHVPTRLIDVYEDVLKTGSDIPALEQLMPLMQFPLGSIFDYLPKNFKVVFIDQLGISRSLEVSENILAERRTKAKDNGYLIVSDNSPFLTTEQINSQLENRGGIVFDSLSLVSFDEPSEVFTEVKDVSKLDITPNSDLLIALQRNKHTELPFKPLADEIILRRSQGYEVVIVVSHPSKLRRISELLESYKISSVTDPLSFSDWLKNLEGSSKLKNKTASPVTLLSGQLSSGIRIQRETLLIISDHEIFPDISYRQPSKSAQQAKRILGSTSQIKEDDYIVHIDHGVAIYRGLKAITVDGKTRDFLQLEYAEDAKLFVPVENISRVQKYVGAEGIKPALSRLGGKAWSATKEKVRKNVQELAGQLLNLYAERELVKGHAFGDFDKDDQIFADTFSFQETKDQENAINDVLNDMALVKPMDRLVCGDVGYGKTEVALRAAFKAVNNGKQAAILVPTTILADQHYKTFKSRLSEFGFDVRSVSRFVTPAKNKETLQALAAGNVDVIVGTHRLLQKDVYFKDLGLLVIDEEHRFGVQDKEKLKKLRKQLDVLTLTATPIPRTLQMSMLSIRDLSVIETPPVNRQTIQTFVANYQDATVREAILRELSRSGQIFYIHNRVHNIELVTNELRAIVPEARIEFAHGQMKEGDLEKVMHRFITHEFDVLVSTTIVESGLDISNANTIIIRNADKLGLAELYQLRGRVGRSSRRAYAYLMVQNAQTITGDAKKRLQVLQSLDDLGMGFRLALQDMEIRGAGNLLGKDQSGKVELVGFELYTKILKEAVRELRRRQQKDGVASADDLPLEILIDPEINIGFSTHIPNTYIPDVEERLLLYQRLVEIRDNEEANDIEEEIQDRFGNPPVEVRLLLEVMRFRSTLRKAGIITANRRGLSLSLTFHKEANLDGEKLAALIGRSKGVLKMTSPQSLVICLDAEPESPAILTKKVAALVELIKS
jgi:transcription-repair coupling factor (superfamily II helicase)